MELIDTFHQALISSDSAIATAIPIIAMMTVEELMHGELSDRVHT